MNDREARSLLAGIDAPRPLPDRVRSQLEAALLDADLGLAGLGSPRPLPDDLRRRLEASLVQARPMPLPRAVRRALLAAAAAVTVAGLVVIAGDGDGTEEPTPVAGGPSPATSPDGPPPGETGSDAVSPAGTASPGSAATGGSTAETTVPFQESSEAPGDASPAPAAGATAVADAGEGAIAVAVRHADGDVAAGFDAYLRTLNGSGGIDGRAVATVDGGASGSVATVNLDDVPVDGPVDGVLFETAFVDEARLTGDVVSMASPIERQARLAVAAAFPDRADGRRAAVYAGSGEPWATIVPGALEAALRERGATPVRIAFQPSAPAFVPADAAFLSLAPVDVDAYVAAAAGAPPRGTWGVGSAWDDALAARGEAIGLRVLSPYAPVGGDEQATLHRELQGQPLSAGAVHGWVTAKALAVLLARNGGTTITEADLDGLAGWEPGWAPPFEVRPGTRARTPDAAVLRPAGSTFARDGDFRRA